MAKSLCVGLGPQVLAVVALMLFSPCTLFASTHVNKEVVALHSPDSRDCSFFMLSGVNEAHPAVPGSPWFAISKSHQGYKEIVAMLLIARTTGRALNHVGLSGAIVCGHAAVVSVSF